MPRPLALALLSLSLLFLLPARADADTVVIAASRQGWYSDDGDTNGGLFYAANNYFVGASSGSEYRNYFVFDLGVVRDVTSAKLRIYTPGDSNLDTDAFETYVLSDVTTAGDLLGMVDGV